MASPGPSVRPVRRAREGDLIQGMSAVGPQVEQSSPAEVGRWRLKELLRAGYTWDQGVMLACRPEVDLHLAIDLLRNGCPPTTALTILL